MGRALIQFSIDNPLVVNMLLVLVLIAGVLSWQSMPQEMFPIVETDKLRITTIYEGAAPEEVEKQVTLPIEEEFDALADIDEVTSTSDEGVSNIIIKLKAGTDVDDFIRDAESALDQVTDLPAEAEEPKLTRLKTRFPVISVALYGDAPRSYLADRADDVRRQLALIDGVASVGIAGDRERELWVVVEPEALAAFGITLDEIERALRENLPDLPGGSLRSNVGDILLRGKGVEAAPEALEEIVLRSNTAGGTLTLGQVARVESRLEEARTLGRFNGRPSVNMTVTKTASASTIKVADEVITFVDELNQELPPSIRAGLFQDISVYVRNRLETVKASGLVGLVLLLVALYALLNMRVALVTAMGIPVSVLFAVIGMFYFGYTINMVSLFAFLIALGLIVDDAIIVTENIYRHMEEGLPPAEAARVGAREVFWPVVAATSTTIAAFMPMFAVGGVMGAFIAVIPAVVAASLVGSVLEAFGVLPSHAREWLKVRQKAAAKPGRQRWQRMLDRYVAVLRWSLVQRYTVAVLAVGLLVVAAVYAQTRLPFQLFGKVEVGQFFVNIEAPTTYGLEDSTELARQVEQAMLEVIEPHELKSMLTNVGTTLIDFQRFKIGNQYIQLIVDLEKSRPEGVIETFISPLVSLKWGEPEGRRERSADVIIEAVRGKVSDIPGVRRFSILRPDGGPAGADIEIGVNGDDPAAIRASADELRDWLARLPGVKDVRHDGEPGKLEYRYQLNEVGRELGLTQAQLARAVRTGFFGREVVHVNADGERLPVRLIFSEAERERADALGRLRISLPSGQTVYLRDVADIESARALAAVNRRDMQRLVTVTAETDDTVTTPEQVIQQFEQRFADFSKQYPGQQLVFLGEKRESAEALAGMNTALVLALGFIFFILATLFRSLLDPLVVMGAIPFGIIGVVIGHALLGHHLQFLSGIGFLALAGIIVNDSLILVDFAKRLRRQGWERHEAVLEAARVRVRPILLTTITTFLSISPLIFFSTGQTAFLAPMAVSLGFGLVFATGLILVAVPSFYLIADDLRSGTARLWRAIRGDVDPEAEQGPMCRIDEPH